MNVCVYLLEFSNKSGLIMDGGTAADEPTEEADDDRLRGRIPSKNDLGEELTLNLPIESGEVLAETVNFGDLGEDLGEKRPLNFCQIRSEDFLTPPDFIKKIRFWINSDALLGAKSLRSGKREKA